MRVLFVTCHLPYPPWSGGRLREHELLRRLTDHHEVHLLATSKVYDEDHAALDRTSGLFASVTLLPVEAGGECPRGVAPQAYRHRCLAAYLKARGLARRVELVHVEGFYLMQHIGSATGLPIVLTSQNVESSLWQQRARLGLGNRYQANATTTTERRAWRRATRNVALTREDQDVIAAHCDTPVDLVPDGADHLPIAARSSSARHPTIVTVGNYAYEPSADGVQWFCRDVLPLVRAAVPDVRYYIVGNAPPPEVRALESADVVVTGRVHSVLPYLQAAHVVAAPLRIGGGVKVKVLEALRVGRAVATTPVGAQGLDPAALMVTHKASSFAAAVIRTLRSPERRAAAETAARRYARTLPTWDAAAGMMDASWRAAVTPQAARTATSSAAC